HIGATATSYTLSLHDALPILAALAELEKISGQKVTPSEEELRLFGEAADGKLGRWSFADAALLASGCTDKAKRKEYLARLDAVEDRKSTRLNSSHEWTSYAGS